MKRTDLRKTLLAAALIAGTFLGANALADAPQGNHRAGYGMGGGMMGGYEDGSNPDLTTEQRGRIVKIRDDVRRKHWALMGKMQDEQSTMNEQYRSTPRDNEALSKSYGRMSGYRHEMFDLSLSARKQIDAVLTPEQREKRTHG